MKILSLRREQEQRFFIRSVGIERIVSLSILLSHPSFFSSFFSLHLLFSSSGFLLSHFYTFYSFLSLVLPLRLIYDHLVFIFFLPHPSNFQYQLVSISLSILAQHQSSQMSLTSPDFISILALDLNPCFSGHVCRKVVPSAMLQAQLL